MVTSGRGSAIEISERGAESRSFKGGNQKLHGSQPDRPRHGAGGPAAPRPQRRGRPGGAPRLAEHLALGPFTAHPAGGRSGGGEQRAAGQGGGVRPNVKGCPLDSGKVSIDLFPV